VQVHGTLEEVTDPAAKARALEALMHRWQPEGRYQPIDPEDPHYRGQLAGTLVLRVAYERVDGKEKLLQDHSPEERARVLEGLWERGEPGDPAAIEAVRGAGPAAPVPSFLAGPEGLRLAVALGEGDAAQAERLLAGEHWWDGVAPAALIQPAQRASAAWVGAHDGAGRLVGMARAVADGRVAWLYDVVVERAWRGRGLGKRLLALLLDHPAVRRAPFVRLTTRDAQGLYAGLGFVDAAERRRWPEATDMVRVVAEPGPGGGGRLPGDA
jgi:ribosomal protein S18 acetylase RimI-like enzyme